jgi:opacity protein-like surface antigen
VLGLRYQRLLLPTSQQAGPSYDAPLLWFTADLAAADVHIPATARPEAILLERTLRNEPLSTRGLGTYPLGLRLEFRQWKKIRPFIAGQTGIFYFSDALPDERGHNVNFAAGLGGGLRMALTDRTVLTLGYRYHHLSNGFRGSINPGLDANVLYLGVGTAL